MEKEKKEQQHKETSFNGEYKLQSLPTDSDNMNAAKAMYAQREKEIEDTHKTEMSAWKELYNSHISNKKNLYKADPTIEKRKQLEGSLKTLFSGLGTLFAYHTPIQNHGQTIQKSFDEAEQSRKAEEAAEYNAHQQWQKQLNDILSGRPKRGENSLTAPLFTHHLSSDAFKWQTGYKHKLDAEKQGKEHAFKAGESAKERALKEKLAGEKNAATNKNSTVTIFNKKDTTKKIVISKQEAESLLGRAVSAISNVKKDVSVEDILPELGKAKTIGAKLNIIIGKYPGMYDWFEKRTQQTISSAAAPEVQDNETDEEVF
ncbi:MAG: hypothetical protein LBG17_03245 [Bacteroidales bacterium]|jgi:hypothetical protein|nr:hypothetical protein [Bacteroidales bacterium]